MELLKIWRRRVGYCDIIVGLLFILSCWSIIAIQFHKLPCVPTCMSVGTAKAMNTALLTLSYSYIAAFVFYLLTTVIPAMQRQHKLNAPIKKRVSEISRGIRDILLEFARDTNYKVDERDTTDTGAILRSKDWFAIVPMIQKYRHLSVTYIEYMKAAGNNVKSQIANIIARYHGDLTPNQLIELEALSDSQFFRTIDFICSIPNTTIADSGYSSLIDDFIALQNQYLKVEKEFGIE